MDGSPVIETVKTERFTMDYFRFGQGGETLVILPGLSVLPVTGAAEAVREAYRLLAEDFTIYLFERRNDLPQTYPVRRMAEDTAEAIRALGLGPVCLFGASMGGMIAMEIAILYPELVGKLILGSTSARVEDGQYRSIAHWIDLAEAGEARELCLAFGQAVYPAAVYEQSKDFLLQLAETVKQEDLARFVIQARGIRGFDVSEELEKITCPVLVIGSGDDRILGGAASAQIAAGLTGTRAQLHMYKEYGHAAYDTAPDYRERMLRFLAGS